MISHSDQYVRFVQQRHTAWLNRQMGIPRPWCNDPIIQTRKFTNVFRILDPGTQFIWELADGEPEDVFARIFLYRHTNLPAAWRAYREEFGSYPDATDLHLLEDFWLANGIKVFNGAYNIYPQSSVKGTNKVSSVVRLTHQFFVVDRYTPVILDNPNPELRFNLLKSVKGVGAFMAMQILTDLGYVMGWDENEFIAAGPGAVRGAKLVDPLKPPAHVIHSLKEFWDTLGTVWLELPDGTRHYPSLMDVQNTLCEYQKYVRYLSRPTPTKLYRPVHRNQFKSIYPSHWSHA